MTLLEKYTSPDAFLAAPKDEIINSIQFTPRFGLTYAYDKYNAIIQAAIDANTFCHAVSSNYKRIRLYISFIRKYDEEISSILSDMHTLVDANEATDFVKQIHLINSFKCRGFLSAVSLMDEIGDFLHLTHQNSFLLTSFGSSGKTICKFNSTKIRMSKRGSRIARRVINTMALIRIIKNKDGSAKNPVLRDYYLLKCQIKPKMVALGAVMHKVCNIVFAILRDEKEFEIIPPKELA